MKHIKRTLELELIKVSRRHRRAILPVPFAHCTAPGQCCVALASLFSTDQWLASIDLASARAADGQLVAKQCQDQAHNLAHFTQNVCVSQSSLSSVQLGTARAVVLHTCQGWKCVI